MRWELIILHSPRTSTSSLCTLYFILCHQNIILYTPPTNFLLYTTPTKIILYNTPTNVILYTTPTNIIFYTPPTNIILLLDYVAFYCIMLQQILYFILLSLATHYTFSCVYIFCTLNNKQCDFSGFAHGGYKVLCVHSS